MTELHFRSAKQLASDIRRRKVGCLEALDAFLARRDRFNPKLNAIVVTDVEGARRRAKQADAALRKGKVWGPLHGVPMTIKESYDVAGMPTTWGLPALKGNIAPRNALSTRSGTLAKVISPSSDAKTAPPIRAAPHRPVRMVPLNHCTETLRRSITAASEPSTDSGGSWPRSIMPISRP